jgi:hypothetical protein
MGCDPNDEQPIRRHEGEVQRLKDNSALVIIKNLAVFGHRALQQLFHESEYSHNGAMQQLCGDAANIAKRSEQS